MKDVIWLRVDKAKVLGMTKGIPALSRGELPVKLIIEVDPSCWGSPTLEQRVHVADWRQGMDLPDVGMSELVISESEAAMIRAERERKMAEELRRLGYRVEEPESKE